MPYALKTSRGWFAGYQDTNVALEQSARNARRFGNFDKASKEALYLHKKIGLSFDIYQVYNGSDKVILTRG